MLKHLNEVNDVKIRSVKDPEFAPFGRVVTGYDFSGLISYMESSTEIPESGNIYHASEPGLEASATATDATPPTTVLNITRAARSTLQ